MGSPVVHGIHTLVWALDTALQTHPLEVQNLRARFHQPLYPGETATLVLTGRTETSLHLEVTMNGIVIAAIRILLATWKDSGNGRTVCAVGGRACFKAPHHDFSIAQMASLSGQQGRGASHGR